MAPLKTLNRAVQIRRTIILLVCFLLTHLIGLLTTASLISKSAPDFLKIGYVIISILLSYLFWAVILLHRKAIINERLRVKTFARGTEFESNDVPEQYIELHYAGGKIVRGFAGRVTNIITRKHTSNTNIPKWKSRLVWTFVILTMIAIPLIGWFFTIAESYEVRKISITVLIILYVAWRTRFELRVQAVDKSSN